MSPHLSPRASELLQTLPEKGKAVGHITLRRKLEWPQSEYWAAVQELVRAQLVSRTRGRGGGIRRKSPVGLEQIPLEHAILQIHKSSARAVKAEARKRQNSETQIPADERLENQLWRLLHALGPDYITVGRKPRVLLEEDLPAPDVIGVFDNLCIIGECKCTDDRAFLLKGLEDLRANQNALRKWATATGSFKNIVAILACKTRQDPDGAISRRARELRVKLLHDSRVSYMLMLEKELGIGMAHFFWATVFPSRVTCQDITVPAVKIKTGSGTAVYAFAVNAHDLLYRAYVSHRQIHAELEEEEKIGYQRMLNRSRLNAIKKYVEKYHRFPTPIVVMFEKNSGAGFDFASKEFPGIGTLRLPNRPLTIQVIDGQHRLFGYSRVERSEEHIVHVLGYEYSASLDPAKIFVDINSEQKPVQPGLLWELYPETYSKENPNYHRVLISRAIEGLLTGELLGLVTHIGSQRKGPISFQTICNEIDKSGLVSRDGGLVARIAEGDSEKKVRYLSIWMEALFCALKRLGAESRDVNELFIFSNVGIPPVIQIFHRILADEVVNRGPNFLRSKAEIQKVTEQYFKPIYDYFQNLGPTQLGNLRKERVARAGFARTEEQMTHLIQYNYKRSFPARRPPTPFEELADNLAYNMDQLNQKAFASGKVGDHIFSKFDHWKFAQGFKGVESKKGTGIDARSFDSVVDLFYNVFIEDTGGKPSKENNRLARLWGVGTITDVPVVRLLDTLRTGYSHSETVTYPGRKQAWLAIMRDLTEKKELLDKSELFDSDYLKAATNLVTKIKQELVDRSLDLLKGGI